MKVLFAAFMHIKFVFVICWQKQIRAKTAHKMLLKLATDRKVRLTVSDPMQLTMALVCAPSFIIARNKKMRSIFWTTG